MSAEREAELLRRSLAEIRRLRAELAAARAPAHPPIAIIGIGLRLPGGEREITDLDGLWSLLAAGGDAVREIPPERFDIAPWYDPDRDAAGKSYARRAALLEDIAGFDAELFGVSPKEARHLDPQQRLVLETARDALERAGCPPASLAGSRTGVFVGAAASRYCGGDDVHAITGQDSAFTAGRLAYVLGLHGPALAVNTTCSSSLVALHLAVRALRAGECDLALAAGANAIVEPAGFVQLSRAQALAPDGRCKTFSALADGFGRGEGAVTVALSRLPEALAQGRPILALIRGTALDHDGASSGITAPNGTSQRQVIRAALEDAGLGAADIDAVECHGTGTVLGDPIEVNALAEVYGGDREGLPPLALSAVKACLGHLEPAAGLAGLAALLAGLEHGQLAGNPRAEPPNPHIDWAGLALSAAPRPTPWPRGERVRRAGLSSFGMSGTNAHVIIEEAPARGRGEPDLPVAASLPLLLSGQDQAALRAQATRWADWLATRPGVALAAVKRSAALHRAHLDARAAVFGEDADALATRLRRLAAGDADDAVLVGSGRRSAGAVFVFPGHGSQWAGMGAALLRQSAAFAAAVDACDAALAPHTGWSVRAVLAADADAGHPDAERIDVIQPCLFAMGVALAAVWRDELGVAPAAVVGHSVGEIAAAVVAGALTLDDGARLVALRGRLIAATAAGQDPGAMLAVAAPAEAVAEQLKPWQGQLCIAVVNAADTCVVAGDRDAAAALQDALAARGIGCRWVAIGFGAHSPLLDPVLAPFAAGIGDLAPQPAGLAFYSAIDGAPRDGATLDVGYWQDNVRATVRFDRAIAAIAGDDHRAFIELGGHPVLVRPIAATVGRGAVVVGSLRRDAAGLEALHRGLATLHCGGLAIDWAAPMGQGPVAALPTYVFQRRRHWLDQTPAPPPGGPAQPQPHAASAAPVAPAPVPAAASRTATAAAGTGGATPDFMSEQLRVFAQLTRRQMDLASAFAAGTAASAQDAPDPDALATDLADTLERALDGVDSGEQRLEQAAVGYIRSALRQLGLRPEPGARFSTAQLIERLGIVPAHHRLTRRLCAILAQAGDLRGDGTGWTVLRGAFAQHAADAGEAPSVALDPAPARVDDARMALLSRCAGRLADVLTGRQAPLGLLFPDGDAAMVNRVYADTAATRAFNAAVADAAAAVVGARPAPTRVLEIGAGSGGTTAAVLPRLPAGHVRYVFTDLGAGFLPAARAKFADFPFIDYRPLDIEQPPASQGFETGAYDLVLAANVLHATRGLAETASHAASLLAPGGVLLLLEAVRPLAWVDLTFGLTTGWWRFQDTALRPDHPLIDAGQWRALLADLGLAGATSIVHPGSELGIIIATRPQP